MDAFRIVNSKSIFPNIGNAENDLGDALSLIKNGTEFLQGGLQDVGKAVWELMDVDDVVNNVKVQGFKLLNDAFDLPDTEFELIDLGDGNFRIYIEYAGKDANNNPIKGDLNFSIDSAANQLADTWKSKMSNMGLVVDLAGIERLVTIRGKWDSKKGSEAACPQPDLEFAPELQPIIDILEILQQLQGGDYAGAVGNGLKLAMSNKAGSWEYKFEASKEIPVLRFPVPDDGFAHAVVQQAGDGFLLLRGQRAVLLQNHVERYDALDALDRRLQVAVEGNVGGLRRPWR